jgi:hypothetical protein
MAKRRHLKRNIGYIAGELFMEVLVSNMLYPEIGLNKSDELLERIQKMEDEFVLRAAKPDAKENKKLIKAYYRKLEADLQQSIDSIVSDIQTLSKDNKGGKGE